MAGVDQGEAVLAAVSEPRNFTRLYLTSYEGGIGTPVSSTANGGRLRAFPLSIAGLSGPSTAAPRASVAKPAGASQGEAVDTASSDKITPQGANFFERIHILPNSKIDFGNIITQKTEQYEIYNAHRTEDKTLNTITNNASPGVTLPDESTPEVIEAQSSALDSTSTDNTGDTFALGTLVQRDVVASADGLPIFDTNIIFDFAGTNDVQLLVAGTRLVLFPFEYESPSKETLAFLTDIIESLNGEEQRIALRKNPRQVFEVEYLLDSTDRQRMQVLLMDWMHNFFGFPVWSEQLRLTAAVSAGATSYPISGGDDVDLRDGGLAVVLTDANTFDVIQVVTATDTTITANDPSLNGYPAGTKIMPLRTVRMLGSVAAGRALNNLERFRIRFEVTDNDSGALTGSTTPGFWSLHTDGRVLFDDCNVSSGEMREDYIRRIHVLDNDTGKVTVTSPWDRNKRVHAKGFMLRNRSEIMQFRNLMVALRGRQKAFWIPTFAEDVTVKASLTTGTRTLDINLINYQRFAQERNPKRIFRITFNNGDPALVKTIISSAGVDATTERLTFSNSEAAWPSTYTVDEVERIEFFELVRFDTDDIEMTYRRIGLAEARLPVRQVFDDD